MTSLTTLAAFCWQEIEVYQDLAMDKQAPPGYYEYCRGRITAYEVVLRKLEEIEDSMQRAARMERQEAAPKATVAESSGKMWKVLESSAKA